jgi:hypothetical protein
MFKLYPLRVWFFDSLFSGLHFLAQASALIYIYLAAGKHSTALSRGPDYFEDSMLMAFTGDSGSLALHDFLVGGFLAKIYGARMTRIYANMLVSSSFLLLRSLHAVESFLIL